MFSSLKSNLPLENTDKFNWILVTDSDITDKVKSILSSVPKTSSSDGNNGTASGNKTCSLKSMFLVVPQTNVPTKEFNKYFEHEIATYATKSVHPLVAQFSKQYLSEGEVDGKKKKLLITSSEGLSLTMKSVWALAMSLKKMEDQSCLPFNLTKADCLEKLRNQGLREGILTNTKNMNHDKLTGLGIAALEGFPLKFNKQNMLQTTKYSLKIITSSCKIFDAGHFTEDEGLQVNEVVFNTLRIEAEATPSASIQVKPTASYYVPNLPKSNRTASASNVSARSLRPSQSFEKMSSLAELKAGMTSMLKNKSAVTPDDAEENEDDETETVSPTVSSIPVSSIPVSTRRPKVTATARSVTADIFDSANMASRTSADDRSRAGRESNLKRYRDLMKAHGSASLTSWLGKGWSFVVLGFAIIGALITLYTFTFLLMKSCEGSLGEGHKQTMICLNLLAIMTLFLGSVLYLFEPTPVLCTIRRSIHNLSLVLLFGCLLIKSMFLRAQKTIGLGGQVNHANQYLSLAFMMGIQISIEAQSWKLLNDWSTSNIVTYSVYSICSPGPNEYLLSQTYILLLFGLLLIFSWISRNEPVMTNEGSNLFTASAVMSPIIVCAVILGEYFIYDPTNVLKPSSSELEDPFPRLYSSNRDIISAACMITVAYMCLACVFLPIMYTIHKFGTLVSTKIASHSYTDSSTSTAFTLFRANGMNPAVVPPPSHMRSHHPHGHHDTRAIMDNLSTSSNSSNNESFLAVSSNPNRLLVHNNGRPVSKGIKKNKKSSSSAETKAKLKNSSAVTSSSTPHMIFSPVTNSYSYACNSPNCNFKLQPRTARIINPYTNQRTLSNQISSSALSEGHLNRHHHHPASYATHPSFNLPGAQHASRFSLFRSDIPSLNRFASSLHPSGLKGPESTAQTTNSSYNRLNPLFETTEGSFRSAYP